MDSGWRHGHLIVFATPFPCNFGSPYSPVFSSVGAGGDIYDGLLVGNVLYVTGAFTTVTDASGTVTRNHAASINMDTQLWTSWNPNLNGDGVDLATDGTWIYISGAFTAVNGGTARNYLTRVNASSGTYDSVWLPTAGNIGRGVAYDSTVPSILQGSTTTGPKSFNLTNGTATVGYSTPTLSGGGGNSTLRTSGGVCYFGGFFTTVNGTGRNNGASISCSTGSLGSWNPNTNQIFSASIISITLDVANSLAYLSGTFNTVNGGTSRKGFAQVDLTNATLTSWVADTNTNQVGIFTGLINSKAYPSGQYTAINGTSRLCIARTDTTTGTLDSFNPGTGSSQPPRYYAPYQGAIVTVGQFTAFNGSTRNRIAVFNPNNGVPY